MEEKKYRKAIIVCRIITIISALLYLIFIAILLNLSNTDMWGHELDLVIKAVAYILTIAVFLPPFLILYFQIKIKEHMTNSKIEELKREIEQLKKK